MGTKDTPSPALHGTCCWACTKYTESCADYSWALWPDNFPLMNLTYRGFFPFVPAWDSAPRTSPYPHRAVLFSRPDGRMERSHYRFTK